MKKNGFTLIEVLVALVLVGVAFMGMAKLLFESRKQIHEVQQRSIALSLVNDMIGRMTANPQGLSNYHNTSITAITLAGKNCQADSTCTAAEMAAYDLQEWAESLVGSSVKKGSGNDAVNVGGLVSPVGCITVVNNAVTLSIAWRGKQAQTETTDRAAKTCGKDNANFTQVADNDLRRLLEVTTTIGS
ncbi:type IV pilus modification protein PilV [uncultured Endozoicomonas sp.]|uniref:type IV pilus modification protein PilV n=1 Tax=uncultured Endozoicomonas sp. TaxID=432652 RepID=UPI002638795E|nr:type IV pilus modification protein PilV [uncultured Endozoicomonas sp.]